MAKIEQITKAYIRTYRDSEQETAYVEWVDSNGETGRTEGQENGLHMQELLRRADREDIPITYETW